MYVSSEGQSSSGRILVSISERRDRSPLSTQLSWPLKSVSVCAAKSPAASRVVRPTAALPALTSQGWHVYVLCGSNTASHPWLPRGLPSSLFQCGSLVLQSASFQSGWMRASELLVSFWFQGVLRSSGFSFWSHVRSRAHGLSLLSPGCQSVSPACSPV